MRSRVSGDFRLYSAFFGLIRHRLFHRRDGDGSDEGHEAFQIGEALGLDTNDGKVVFAKLVVGARTASVAELISTSLWAIIPLAAWTLSD